MQRLNAQIENPSLISTPYPDFTPLNEELVANAGIQDYTTPTVIPVQEIIGKTPIVEPVQEVSPYDKLLAFQNMLSATT